MPTERSVKLGTTLRHLLEARGYTKNYARVAEAAQVSRSALSQYLSGRAHPRLDTLVLLANFLETSLDHLVFGTPLLHPDVVDPGPVVRYADIALSDLRQRAADHANLVGRIGVALAAQIDRAADSVAQQLSDGPVGGLLDEDETVALEQHSEETWCATLDMQQDLLEVAGAPDGSEAAPGLYSRVVARNLVRGRTYRFLLTGTKEWPSRVRRYLQLLADQGVPHDALAAHCMFKSTTAFLPVDFALYRLNVRELSTERPLLYEHIRQAMGPQDTLGYAHSPSRELTSKFLMSRERLHYSFDSFARIWQQARVVR
jgi:transcriptional regulator with XRE-family HTH domain